jgi:hypothetical protein
MALLRQTYQFQAPAHVLKILYPLYTISALGIYLVIRRLGNLRLTPLQKGIVLLFLVGILVRTTRMHGPIWFEELFVVLGSLGVPAALVSLIPDRYRLALELLILFVCVFLGLWSAQDTVYARESNRVKYMADQAAAWADETASPSARLVFQTEAAWFRRRARGLRIQAMGLGFIAFLKQPFGKESPDDDAGDFIRQLALAEVSAIHEVNMLAEHERLQGQ